MKKYSFFICGITGWCLEIFWTGLNSVFSGELTMMGKTSLLMFPIYGCAAVIGPVSRHLHALPTLLRGFIYMTGIFFAEFCSGTFLRHFHICPWDYSHSPYHYKSVIRLDYIPLWFVVGLLFEKILAKLS